MSTFAQRVQLGPFFSTGVIDGAAKLEHYAAGTSTLKNIWSDRGMATPLAQPFVADADGIFNFFADGLYKLVIKKADDTVLYTLDDWQLIDRTEPTFGEGTVISSASTIAVGPEVFAHISGSTNITTITGAVAFFWAVFDGNLSLIHSASLLMPDSRNRKMLTGDVAFFLNEGAGVWRLGAHMQTEGSYLGRYGASVAASATLAVPTDGDMLDVSGTTTITAVGSAAAGYRFLARFTGAGLNLTYNATSLITQWARDYRTVPNEVMEFISLGSGNWMVYSLNGPKERVGVTIEGNTSSAPAGYLDENGTAVSRTTFAGLFAEISTTFGVGDGSTTFNVPDSRGRTIINVDGAANRITSASTNGANADTLGGAGGTETHTITTAESAAHTHNVTDSSGNALWQDNAGAGGALSMTTGILLGASTTQTTRTTTESTGGGGAHSNTQPWIAKNKLIRF